MSKQVVAQVKLMIPAGNANPAPPVGTALGPRGVNIMSFCQQFNAKTKELGIEQGSRVSVIISVFADKSFSFIIKTPPVSDLLKKKAGVAKGSSNPKKDIIGKVTRNDCVEIAKIKLKDLNTRDLDVATEMVIGSAKSMGLNVLEV